jgi:uncharacterized protein YndB with AHSA1/START domain
MKQNDPHAAKQPRLKLERTYRASIEAVWELWTTKDGIESWWGPEGFAVIVQLLDLRPGGLLRYTMTATAPEQIAFMQRAGMPISVETTITFTEVVPFERLGYVSLADFIPGVAPYDVGTLVEFFAHDDGVRMVLSFDPMHDETWTRNAKLGHEGQLRKLEALLTQSSRR